MLDVHPPQHTPHTWRDFFIHIATIVLGLVIAIGLEQTVESVHHLHQARVARNGIQREINDNILIEQQNLQALIANRGQLMKVLDLLDSDAPDNQVLPYLEFAWPATRQQEAAWDAAKIDGALALIPANEIGRASFSYSARDDVNSTNFAYLSEIETIVSIGEHGKSTGKLTPLERQQLSTVIASALGHGRVIDEVYQHEIQALQSTNLR
jgi:hypothetical protein